MLQKLLRNFSTNFGHIDPCLSSLLIWWQTTTALAYWINRLLSPTFEHHFIVRSMKRRVRLEKHYIWVNQEWATDFETVIMRNMLTEKINLFELLILWSVSRARQSAKKVVKNFQGFNWRASTEELDGDIKIKMWTSQTKVGFLLL